MKIGVITFWYGNSNYGMILQCWALQQYLIKLGHEPYVIRYKPERPWYICFAKWFINIIMCIFSRKRRSLLRQEEYNVKRDKEREFDKFRKDHLLFSERLYTNIDKLRKEPPVADCYIAGSDQIWCYDVSFDKNARGFFLDFGGTNIKRIAYAPSFGHMVYTNKNGYSLADVLSKFDYVSCREIRGVEMCRQYGVEAQQVVDPTLLLSCEDYESLFNNIEEDNYLFIYSVNIGKAEDIYWKYLQKLFYQKKIIVTPASGSIVGGEMFGDGVTYNYATPSAWLSLIKNADIVITSSFHGVVFSIIFNKRFAFVPIKGAFESTNNRVLDLLAGIGLDEFVVSKPEDYQHIISKDINWPEIMKNLSKLTMESKLFMENSLEI